MRIKTAIASALLTVAALGAVVVLVVDGSVPHDPVLAITADSADRAEALIGTGTLVVVDSCVSLDLGGGAIVGLAFRSSDVVWDFQSQALTDHETRSGSQSFPIGTRVEIGGAGPSVGFERVGVINETTCPTDIDYLRVDSIDRA